MNKGWFKVVGLQDGDRTLHDQMKGLATARIQCRGRTVLDLGCAEGLVSREFAEAGAATVIGCDVLAERIQIGRGLCKEFPQIALHVRDLNEKASLEWVEQQEPQVVLMLAILHKLREPGLLVSAVAKTKPALIVVRLPPQTAPVIIDKRSGNRPCNVQTSLAEHGYKLQMVTQGHFDEWTGYFA